MSLTLVRSYFRTRMDSLNHKEWKDGFGEEIPQSIIHRSYHLNDGDVSVNSTGNKSITFNYPMNVRLFLKGYRKPADAIDEGFSLAETAIKDICSSTNRIQNCIKNVLANGLSVEPLDDSNDNSVIVNMDFNVTVIIPI